MATAATSKQQSLAVSVEKGLTVEMPEEMGGMVIEKTRIAGPYVVFAQPKSTEQWQELSVKIPGLQDGDQVFVRGDPHPPQKITPMRFTMMACRQFWIQKDGSGKQTAITTENPGRKDGWKEQVFAACLVYLTSGSDVVCEPATCTFKTVKCSAAMSMKLQIDAAADLTWAQLSPAHKVAFGAFQKPFLRVVGTISIGSRTGGKGFAYVPARSVVSPATPSEWKAVKDLLESDGKEKIAAMSAAYHARLQELGVK